MLIVILKVLKKYGQRLFLGLLYFLVSSCANDHEVAKPATDTCLKADSTISFTKVIKPIFNNNCALPNCHSGSSPQGKLDLDSTVAYSQITKRGKGYIDTLNPDRSVLYSSLVSVSMPMPPQGKLDDCSLLLIKNWMKQGAKNN